ncbi:MAG: calcium/sodium antiporter [Myxococcota bacterium]|nr:calcium/sodium antiporter [Myxococcota bacterium]
MLIPVILLAVGLVILTLGGEIMVRGASALARGLGVSNLAIGLTVVAFGTSAPELAVNIGAALQDTGGLAFGNIFGSSMANIGLVVGLVAIIQPIPIQSVIIRRELPMMLLGFSAAGVMAFDVQLGGSRNALMRPDGIILLLFFFVFLYYTVGDLRRQRAESHTQDDGRASAIESLAALPLAEANEGISVGGSVIRVVIGLAGLIGGAELTVNSALELAKTLQVNEELIGLTMIAVGTSLPELAAAISSVRHGKADMAVGSVVGSNIFNTLLVAGVTATIRPMPVPQYGQIDLVATGVLGIIFTAAAFTHKRRIVRREGILLMALYVGYMTWRTVGLTLGS